MLHGFVIAFVIIVAIEFLRRFMHYLKQLFLDKTNIERGSQQPPLTSNYNRDTTHQGGMSKIRKYIISIRCVDEWDR